MDMAVWLRARRYRSLLQLIQQLPDANRLNEAIQNDPEQAELIAGARFAAGEDDSDGYSPRVRDFNLTALLLREIREAVMAVYLAVVRSNGGNTSRVKPFPTPETEVDRALARIEQDWSNSILARYGFDTDNL